MGIYCLFQSPCQIRLIQYLAQLSGRICLRYFASILLTKPAGGGEGLFLLIIEASFISSCSFIKYFITFEISWKCHIYISFPNQEKILEQPSLATLDATQLKEPAIFYQASTCDHEVDTTSQDNLDFGAEINKSD